ncbi:hypothetical protein SKAU_G00068190 [Synaphobranchus kaupii]|uniref:Uncharacterized protein n=1 Tax=Synaphobranchus kaupii TaxID=118154 RepID=A0A9Q1G7E2_SYNKA|nr:hypothetical protein SKAU_G00068190 [Synaphobranchus kaupii]
MEGEQTLVVRKGTGPGALRRPREPGGTQVSDFRRAGATPPAALQQRQPHESDRRPVPFTGEREQKGHFKGHGNIPLLFRKRGSE